MVLIAWGVLLGFGGLVSLAHSGGLYYLACGIGSGGVGWLLMRCSRWAMPVSGKVGFKASDISAGFYTMPGQVLAAWQV